jgi:outer membrane protein OmpA-like peptidoglycan-associated protein
MPFKNHKSLVLLGLVALFCFSTWGCATTSFVKKRTQEIEDMAKANQAQIGQLEQKVSEVDAKAEEAKRAANEAWEKAEEAARARGYVGYQVIGERDVNFDFDRHDLTETAKGILDEMGSMMQQKPELVLEIEGHTDNIGPDAYNVILGNKRAENVRRYLTEKFDIHMHRVFFISHGEFEPKTLNDSRSGRAANRRATLLLLGPPE